MAWRLAPTLSVLRAEIDQRFPRRDKGTDGTIGNLAHQATKSDHNPDSRGVVCAIDIDEDLGSGSSGGSKPAAGIVAIIVSLAKAGALPQLYYIIYERVIYSRTRGFIGGRYSGANPHDKHFHLSVYHDARMADSSKPWLPAITVSKPTTPLPEAEAIQEAINEGLGAGTVKVDGWLGPKTIAAVERLYEAQKSGTVVADSPMDLPPPAAAPEPEPTNGWDGKSFPGVSVFRDPSAPKAGVRKLQERLVAHGEKVDVDGYFGPATKAAVTRQQQAQGFTGPDADGIPGETTWRVLMSAPKA